jgi:hypothetical protein
MRVVGLVAVVAACGGDEPCTEGASVACTCTDGGTGAQVCLADGTFDACVCDDTDTDTDTDTDSDTDTDTEPTRTIYVGRYLGASSLWADLPNANGQLGLAAGDAQCVALDVGADHVCDYEELVAAHVAGETLFGEIPLGTTLWVQRTTTETVGGIDYPPGQGANCVDWTFIGNHLADGEYATFDATGVPTYHLDSDAVFDGIDTTHAAPGDLQCGGVTRDLPCCSPRPD